MMDLPPDMQERVVCSIAAAIKNEIPANILLAIAEKEGGKPGQWVRNNNGTYDVGVMQFNNF
ncbi:MAG: conjugal transfer protein TrbN, partial [Nitrosomonas sp.]|nr:conjugal transfer protein TrbN [Nitrosomonas sp.]